MTSNISSMQDEVELSMPATRKGIAVGCGDVVIGADSPHMHLRSSRSLFYRRRLSTDMAAGMARGKLGLLERSSAIKFVLHGKFKPYVTGKDLILHIIGMIGVDGARYKSMEFQGDGVKILQSTIG